MSKIYTTYEARQKRIDMLQKRISILENNIRDYSHNRGCIFVFSLCMDKWYIADQYTALQKSRIELNDLLFE